MEPARTASGYRLYDDAAIERLRAMRRLVNAGWSPSVAAETLRSGGPVPAEAMAAMPRAMPTSAASTAAGPASAERARIDEFLAASIALDAAEVESTLDGMFASGSFEHVADALLLPALVELGDAWADGRLSVGGEHAASHAVLRRLSAAFQAAGRPSGGPGAILVGMPPGGRHELGALAFAVAARRAGLPVLYLGPDLPLEDWVETARRVEAVATVIGVVVAGDVETAADVAVALRATNRRLAVAFGGARAVDAAFAFASRRGVAGSGSGQGRRRRSSTGAPAPIALPGRLADAVDRLRALTTPTAG